MRGSDLDFDSDIFEYCLSFCVKVLWRYFLCS